MQKLFAELRRRNVFRVAGVYAVIGWLLAQAAVLVEGPLSLPAWFDTFILSALLIGFPVAMIFAWAFEMTPEGMKLTANVPEGESIAPKTGRKLDYVIIGGLALVAVMIVADRVLPHHGAPESGGGSRAETGAASVAVLPFIDLSPEGDQEFFSDGVSEEILNVLTRIPKLKVAGRTSSFSFKGKNEDLRAIGEALGVNHVLEGSVRKSGAKLRITAQLIRSSDGFHVWSETYDRDLTDVFGIQEDIAKSVAAELAVSLGLKSGETLVKDRTADVVAYEQYLKARKLIDARGLGNLDAALLLLNETTARDPQFAPAWASIAAVYVAYEAYQPENPPAGNYRQWRAIGRAAAERAIALDPDNAEATAYLGSLLIYEHDLIAGFKAVDRSVELAPDNPAVLDSAAQSLATVGYFDEARALAERAVAADPLVAIYHNTLGYLHEFGRDFGDTEPLQPALEQYRKAQEYGPNLLYGYSNAFSALLVERKFDEALATIQSGADAGAIPAGYLARALAAIEAARQGDAALRASMAATSDRMRNLIAQVLGDTDLLIAQLTPVWEDDYKYEPTLMLFRDKNLFRHPRWKEQVRRDGVLDLWRSRSFPPQCKPIGKDDFECE